ncbi:MAG: PDZ domain-containing protein [Phycisphaerales bacterium]|nr:PDZ domain-containing protein [Phycisphaerales bacterium]
MGTHESALGFVRWAMVVVSLGGAAQAAEQSQSRAEIERTVARLLASDRAPEAAAVLEEFLKTNPADPQILFDASRVSARMGDPRRSASYAIEALRAGWMDDKALDEHPDLASARGHESWEQVVKIRLDLRATGPAPDPARVPGSTREECELGPSATARTSLSAWLDRFGGGRYRIEPAARLNLLVASSIDREGLDRTLAMLAKLADALTQTLLERTPEQAVLLVIATPTDAQAYFKDPQQAGLYEHRLRQLVVRDTGSTLRHEYTHAIHHGHMERLGQRHPLWIQEALATLFEDWERGPNNEVVLKPNLRTNEAYELVRKRKDLPWTEFVALDDAAFMTAAVDHYAQARSMLLYAAEMGKLQEWYRALTKGFGTDPTGRRALEQVFSAPIGRIEEQWRAWVMDRGKIDATLADGDGVMGISVSGVADGVHIDSVQAGGPAQRAGLREGDVIVQIDATEIRSAGDFLVASARRNAGESLAVRFRRGQIYGTIQVRLASGHASPS